MRTQERRQKGKGSTQRRNIQILQKKEINIKNLGEVIHCAVYLPHIVPALFCKFPCDFCVRFVLTSSCL